MSKITQIATGAWQSLVSRPEHTGKEQEPVAFEFSDIGRLLDRKDGWVELDTPRAKDRDLSDYVVVVLDEPEVKTRQPSEPVFIKPEAGVFFVDGDDERQMVIDDYRGQMQQGQVVSIRKLSDFDKDNLSRTVECSKERGLETSAGRLFMDEPLTLVIDFTSMSPAEIASLNELFDDPPRFQGRPLGAGVTIAGMVSRKMLKGGRDAPGPDFWRRMDKQGLKSLPSLMASTKTNQEIIRDIKTRQPNQSEDDEFYDAPQAQEEFKEVDFFRQLGNWKSILFGGIQLSSEGKIHFQKGVLEDLDPNQAELELVNAPWSDQEFTETLCEAVREGGFWANNQWVSLPEKLKLARRNTDPEVFNQRLEALPAGEVSQAVVVINDENFDSLMANISLRDNQLRECNTLNELVKGQLPCSLMVSSSLTEQQWVQLLNRLEKMTDRPGLLVNSETTQPISFKLDKFKISPTAQHGITRQASNDSQDSEVIPDDVFEYEITARTDPQTLLFTLPMLSQKDMAFSEVQSPLMKALVEGRPVHLHGLESNPQVARMLESLLSSKPYVFISGRRIDLPRLNLCCVADPHVEFQGLWKQLNSTDVVSKPEAKAMVEAVCKDQPELQSGLEKLVDLLSAIKTIPASSQKLYPDQPQTLNRQFLERVIRHVRLEAAQDRSQEVTPYHWRKALSDVVAKEYRGAPNVYGFVKAWVDREYPDSLIPKRVDVKAVRQWLQKQSRLDRSVVKDHYWELARHFSSSCLLPAEGFKQVSEEALEKLLSAVVQCLPAGAQPGLAEAFGCQPGQVKGMKAYDKDSYSRLYNALVAAGPEGCLDKETPIHEQTERILAALAAPVAQKKPAEVKAILAQWLTADLLEGDFNDLPVALVQRRGAKYRQKRRVRRLLEKVRHEPLVVLKGEAGTGKTYTAYAVACNLSDQTPQVISLSPEHTQEELFGAYVVKPNEVEIKPEELGFCQSSREVWNTLCEMARVPQNSDAVRLTFDKKTTAWLKSRMPESDFFELQSRFHDQSTEFEPGPLYHWAKNPNPPVLILDEANLVKRGVLQPLTALTRKPRVLSIFGESIELTDKHRVIMTGNPESYDGRVLDQEMRKSALQLHYRPFKSVVLEEAILEPGMPDTWPKELQLHAVNTISTLYQQYRDLLKDHPFGPRDLNDVMARVRGHATELDTPEQVNAVIWESIAECLAGSLDESQFREFRAVRDWFESSFPCDFSKIAERHVRFEQFYKALKHSKPEDTFDYDIPSVKALIEQLWLELEKSDGKHATVIEGEAGRGKDAAIDRLLPFWLASKQQDTSYYRINASPENWDQLKEMAVKAMREGKKLVISELNTLPSRYIEGLFNEVLGGEAAKGFKLLVTINPSCYSGREKFSDAMLSRCRMVKVKPFTEDEFKGILRRKYPGSESFTDWLVTEHCRLAKWLANRGAAVRLPLAKLLVAAAALKGIAAGQRNSAFNSEYQLAKMALGSTTQEEMTVDSAALEAREKKENELSRAVNSGRKLPITVKLAEPDSNATFDEQKRVLVLPDEGSLDELIEKARTMSSGSDQSALGQLLEVTEEMTEPSQTSDELLSSPAPVTTPENPPAVEVTKPEEVKPEEPVVEQKPPSLEEPVEAPTKENEIEKQEKSEKKAKPKQPSRIAKAFKKLPGSVMGAMMRENSPRQLLQLLNASPAGIARTLAMKAAAPVAAKVMKKVNENETVQKVKKTVDEATQKLQEAQRALDEKVRNTLGEAVQKLPIEKIAGGAGSAVNEVIKRMPTETMQGFLEQVSMDQIFGKSQEESLSKDSDKSSEKNTKKESDKSSQGAASQASSKMMKAFMNKMSPEAMGNLMKAMPPEAMKKALASAKGKGEGNDGVGDLFPPETMRAILSEMSDEVLSETMKGMPPGTVDDTSKQNWMDDLPPETMARIMKAMPPEQLKQAFEKTGTGGPGLPPEAMESMLSQLPPETLATAMKDMSLDAMGNAGPSLDPQKMQEVMKSMPLGAVDQMMKAMPEDRIKEAMEKVG